jgi:hypothetical protein
MTVAPSLQTLDREWLAEALGEADPSGPRIASLRVEPLAFTGATTDMARVHIEYADDAAGRPGSLIAKIRARDELRVQMDTVMGLFDREARFYRDIASRVGLRVPRAYVIGDGDRHPLLLEDLGALRLGDQSQGLEVIDAQRCMDALASMHARFWASSELKETWLARPNEGAFCAMVSQLMATGAPVLVERYGTRFPAATLDAIPRDAKRWEQILTEMGRGPHTLVNNDCRLDNLFFDADGAPVFVDWQLTADARATQDVGNLLAGSMEPDDLSTHWESLLRRYHDGLVGHGVHGYSFDECLLHYRQNAVWALGQGMSLLGAVGANDARGVGDKIVVRSLSHIVDLDCFATFAGA